MKMQKCILVLLAAMVLLFALAGCGAESVAGGRDKGYAADTMESMAAAPEMGLSSTAQSGGTAQTANQKLIRTVYLEAETEDLSALLVNVQGRIDQLGGYVESRNVYNGTKGSTRSRNANLTVRIPADKLDQFVEQISGQANVVSHSEDTKDVTLSYVATESRVTALQTEEARLLELLAVAEDLEDLLILEEKLTDVRTELEQHKSQLKLYDNMVDYATVHLTVTEVVEYTVVEEPEPEPSYWKRMGDGFVTSVKTVWNMAKGLTIFLVSAIPYLIIPGGIIAAILIPRALRRRRKKQQDKPQ